MDVCVVISDLAGELQCDLVVTLSDLPGTAGVLPTAILMCTCNSYSSNVSYLQMKGWTTQCHLQCHLQEHMRQHFHLPQR